MEKQIDTIQQAVERIYPGVVRYCRAVWPRLGEQIAHDALIKLVEKAEEFEYRTDEKTFNFVRGSAFGIARNMYRLKDEKCISYNELCETGGVPEVVPAKKQKKEEEEYEEFLENFLEMPKHIRIALFLGAIRITQQRQAIAAKPQQLFLLPEADDDQPRLAKTTKKPKNNNIPPQQIMLW